jgi:hypothetical protein
MNAISEHHAATFVTMYANPTCPACQKVEGTEPAMFAFPPTGADDPHTLVILFATCEPCDTRARRYTPADLKVATKRLSRYFDAWLLEEKVPELISRHSGKRAQA